MKAKEYLTQLKGIDALLLTISTELACAEQGIAPSGTRLSLCPSFSGGKSDKTADGGIKLADLRMQLEENREKYICIKTTAARLINKIDDIDHQKVLYKYYGQKNYSAK